MAYKTLTVPTGDPDEAKELFAELMQKEGITPGMVVSFGEVVPGDAEYNKKQKQHKIIINDMKPEDYDPEAEAKSLKNSAEFKQFEALAKRMEKAAKVLEDAKKDGK